MAGHDLLAHGAGDETATADAVLATLLRRHPTARVGAVDELAVPVPMPASAPVPPERRLGVRSTLDLVVPADRVVVVGLFARARTAGIASGPVRPVHDPEHPVSFFILDARPLHGVMLAVICDELDNDADGQGQALGPEVAPRVARVIKDGSSVFTEVDEAFPRMLGRQAEDIVGRRSLELVHPDDHDVAIANWIDMLDRPGTGRRVRLRHLHGDGGCVWLEITNHNHLRADGTGTVIADVVDVSDEMAAHQALEDRERLLHQLAQTVPLGLVHVDPAGLVLFANERLHEMLGAPPSPSVDDLLVQVLPEDRPPLVAALRSTMAGAEAADVEVRVKRSDSAGPGGAPVGEHLRYCAARFRSVQSADGTTTGVIGCLEDVTAGVLLRRDLEAQATYDPLTECHNRSSTLDALQAALARGHRRRGTGTAVVFVDLDRFKPVNDRLGHGAGDQLLTVVARRLQDAVRAEDVVGRIGGDEFLVVCSNVRRAQDAMKIARTIAAHLNRDAELTAGAVPVTASIGAAWTDDPDANADTLVAAADAAMYRSKDGGHGKPVLAAAPFGGPAARAPV